MNILGIDTTGPKIVLTLRKGDKYCYFVGEENEKKHNKFLVTSIENFLLKNSIRISDIDCFGVVVGPGSFTGIRIGVATVNAYAKALDKKIVELTTLELGVRSKDVMTLLDCKHRNYYCGIFENGTATYLCLSEKELKNYTIPKLYMSGTYEKELQHKLFLKVQRGEFVDQARPFYMKKSSAEIEEEKKKKNADD